MQHHIKTVLISTLVFMAFTRFAFSQACCSGGVPVGGSLGLGTADNRSFQFLLTYDYNLLNDLIDVTELLKDDTRSRTTHSAMLEVNYGLSSRFSLAVVLPFIRQERNILTFSGAHDFTVTQGLGDAIVLLKYRVLNPLKRPHTDLVVGAGPKFSTGKTNYTNNMGLILQADMQPGSGSIDGIFWGYYQQRQVLRPNLSLLAISMLRYSGENNAYNSTQVYRFGNDFQLNLGININLFMHYPIDFFAYMRYRYQGEDLIDGSAFPGSGGQWVYAIPGFIINFNPYLSVRFSGDVPVNRKLKGTQLTTSYRLTGAILYTIPSKK